MNRLFLLLAMSLATLAAASSALAEPCGYFTVDSAVKVRNSGTVWSSFSGSATWQVCKLGGSTNGVTAEACDGLLRLLTAAKLSGRKVSIVTADGDGCKTGTDIRSLTLLD